MQVLRVFNNNVVLSRSSSGKELIVTGRGVGFQKREGDAIEEARIVRIFAPLDGRDPDHVAQMLAEIPPEMIEIVSEAMEAAGISSGAQNKPTLMIALADHATMAVRRKKLGQLAVYPFRAEVENLYHEEFTKASQFFAEINRRLDDALSEEEIVAFTLHLVNASLTSGDLTYTYSMTGIIQQMLEIISQTFQIKLDPSSVNVGRFITHLRYLFLRLEQSNQLSGHPSSVSKTIFEAFPKAHACAKELAKLLEIRLKTKLNHDEISYLTLHIERVVNE